MSREDVTAEQAARKHAPTAQRWPAWVYRDGQEPDYRFSFANERTFLAWIRTALAILAGGIALDTLHLSMPAQLQRGAAALLVVLALACGIASWLRWHRAERAMRQGQPLPAAAISGILALVVVATSLAVLVGAF